MFSLTRWQPDNEIAQHSQRTHGGEPLFSLWPEPFGLLRQSAVRATALHNVDISESEEAIHVSLDVPGYDGSDINVRVEGDTLYVSGKLKNESTEGRTLHHVERRQSSFERMFTLPVTVDATKTEAICKNGVLSIKLPKREEAKPKTITVKVQG